MKATFYYNENKLNMGDAAFLLAENYPFSDEQLTAHNKLLMLEKLASTRAGVLVNSLHVSLNFDPSESLCSDQLKAIARDYMEQIGFGNQPYLVYQHFDSAHPHIHLISTNIQADGKPISFHHLAVRASEPARKMIEDKYGLVKADDQKRDLYQLQPVAVERAIYGRSQTKRAIANVLVGVLDRYHYASLAELNALLSLYNVRAESGSEGSRIHRYKGLVYRLLDAAGNGVGVPVKASAFFQNPGLDFLSKRFVSGAAARRPFQLRVKNAVDLCLLDPSISGFEQLINGLAKIGIDLLIRQNSEGFVYGLTYIDHQSCCVFNGSDLGKQYSAKAVQHRLYGLQAGPAESATLVAPVQTNPNRFQVSTDADFLSKGLHQGVILTAYRSGAELIEQLFSPEHAYEPNPFDLTSRRKKRRKKSIVKPQ